MQHQSDSHLKNNSNFTVLTELNDNNIKNLMLADRYAIVKLIIKELHKMYIKGTVHPNLKLDIISAQKNLNNKWQITIKPDSTKPSIFYICPETQLKQEKTFASNIYSLAFIITELLNGENIRDEKVVDGTLDEFLTESFSKGNAVHIVNPNNRIPKTLFQVLEKAQAFNPEDRPSLAELSCAIYEVSNPYSISIFAGSREAAEAQMNTASTPTLGA